MREARFTELNQDRRQLVLSVSDPDEHLRLRVDERLRAAVSPSTRSSAPSDSGQLEIEMQSALRPRQMQSLIRSGQTPEAVAQQAQLPVERIMAFAAPVLAERGHIAELAQRATVRRRGDGPARSLGDWVSERLRERQVRSDSASWDAWRGDDGRWQVQMTYRSGEAERVATFGYDTQGRYVTAADDEARWLVGENSPKKGPQPRGRRLAAVQDTDHPQAAAAATGLDAGRSSGAVVGNGTQPGTQPGTQRATDEPDLLTMLTDETTQLIQATQPGAPAAQPASEPDPEPPADLGRRRGRRARRASVPSWDEIMFGRKSR